MILTVVFFITHGKVAGGLRHSAPPIPRAVRGIHFCSLSMVALLHSAYEELRGDALPSERFMVYTALYFSLPIRGRGVWAGGTGQVRLGAKATYPAGPYRSG